MACGCVPDPVVRHVARRYGGPRGSLPQVSRVRRPRASSKHAFFAAGTARTMSAAGGRRALDQARPPRNKTGGGIHQSDPAGAPGPAPQRHDEPQEKRHADVLGPTCLKSTNAKTCSPPSPTGSGDGVFEDGHAECLAP